MGRRMSVLSHKCCMFVSYVHPLTVLHDLQFVNAGRGHSMEEAYSRAGLVSDL